MIRTTTIEFKVPFYQTDAMQVVWHGNYLKYYEVPDARESFEWDEKQPAILTVPSLNHLGFLHYIIWDGEQYLDPSNGAKRYPADGPALHGKLRVFWAHAILWGTP